MKVLTGQLGDVMVRRLKSDVRELSGGFPNRRVVQIDIYDLPADAAELTLAMKLDNYRMIRERRLESATAFQQAAGALVIGHLQKRLLSSIEAFAKTLAVHRRNVDSALQSAQAAVEVPESLIDDFQLIDPEVDSVADVAGDVEHTDELGEENLPEGNVDPSDGDEDAFNKLVATATASTSDASGHDLRKALEEELTIVDAMRTIAEVDRYKPDRRIQELVDWIGKNMCSGLRASDGQPAFWNDTKVIIFIEYEDIRRYIEERLRGAISRTDRADDRIAVYSGSTSRQRREEIKDAFNTEPKNHPLRILIATDAAREGLNLQRHCRDLFHFDLPWNPGRLDQRNGRIDRKLQPADEVFCVVVQRFCQLKWKGNLSV